MPLSQTLATSTYPHLLRSRAADEPNATALRLLGGASLTYRAWDQRADAVAGGLVAAGCGPGSRVALLFANEQYLDHAAVTLGAMRAGAVVVPLSRSATDRELAAQIRSTAADLIVHGPELPPAGLPGPSRDLAQLTAGDCAAHEHDPAPDDAVEILFTSGSTGAPKPVVVTHASLAGELPVEVGDGPRGLALHALQLGTNWAQMLLRTPLARRIGTLALPRFDVRAAMHAIAVERPSELVLSPTAVALLLAALDPSLPVDSVRRISLSSAPASDELLRRLAGRFPVATISVGYTSTEAWPAHTVLELPPDAPGSVGRPARDSEVRVVGEDGETCAAGDAGSVQLRRRGGPPRRHLDGATVAVDEHSGWIETGDLGRLNADGCLIISGRSTDIVHVGGSKVFCPRVEAALTSHPAVVEAAAVGIPLADVGEQVAAAVVVSEAVSSELLQSFLSSRLRPHEVPAQIELVGRLPLTPAGKVAKVELRARLARGADGSAVAAVPDGREQEHLLELWREALGGEAICPDDDLVAAGATSLLAFAVIARLQVRLQRTVPAGRFLAAATIAEQAMLLQRS